MTSIVNLRAALLIILLVTVCGGQIFDNYILGGSETTQKLYPFQVLLQFERGPHFCGGAILNQNTILTAAHCLKPPDDLPKIRIVAGINRIWSIFRKKIYKAQKIAIHENYRDESFNDDIGLIILTKNITFKKGRIQPVRLPTEDTPPGTVLTSIGWGVTEEGELSNQLRHLNVTSISNEECQQKLKQDTIFETMICVTRPKEHGTCYGDSGSPLVLNDTVIGITSYNAGSCGSSKPDVYTRVYKYLDWIKQHTHVEID